MKLIARILIILAAALVVAGVVAVLVNTGPVTGGADSQQPDFEGQSFDGQQPQRGFGEGRLAEGGRREGHGEDQAGLGGLLGAILKGVLLVGLIVVVVELVRRLWNRRPRFRKAGAQ